LQVRFLSLLPSRARPLPPRVTPIAPLKILVTGHPQSGKTSTIRAVVEKLRGRIPMTGFLTEEIREDGKRVGFRGVTLDGRDFLLAHARNTGSASVGPYGVDLTGLESIGLESLTPGTPDTLVVVDEIGKMECLSEAFKTRVAELLADDTPLIASVAIIGVGFVKRVRHDPRAKVFTMTRGESERMATEIVRFIERSVPLDEGGKS
jgi:nucleoside-triphosphatase